MVIIIIVLASPAQETSQDTIIELSQVEISAHRLKEYSTGLNIQSIDSIDLELNKYSNLDEIISRETTASIKSYGQGGLATVSFRGTSATHTGIYWNGIQLNPPNIRMFDMSLAPVGYFNSIQILTGGVSSLFGSGNIGGSIHLQNEPVFNHGNSATIGLSAGSFSRFGLKADFTRSGEKLYSATHILIRKSKNDFPFKNLKNETVKQQNAKYNHYGILQDLYWKLNTNWQAGISIWAQSNSSEVPGTLVSNESDAIQDDKSFKGLFSVKHHRQKGYSLLKLAFLHDDLHYFDPDTIETIQIDSKINTDKIVADFQYNVHLFTNASFNSGIQYTNEIGNSNNYQGRVSQNILGLFVSWSHFFPSILWSANINLRQDFIEGYNAPFAPSFGIEGKIWKIIYGKMHLSRNFRAPSFNELYWYPVGNINLQPEESWNQEASILIRLDKKPEHHNSVFTFTAYNSNITNWIAWIPQGSISYPENIRKVHSRGFEFNGRTTFDFSALQFKISEGYTYALSTNENKVNAYDNSFQKQLIYIPKHRFYISWGILYSGFYFNYNHSYNGVRYTTSDNKNEIPAYAVGSVNISKKMQVKGQVIRFQFDIDNLWDTDYQAIENYPMPGRNYNLSINLYLK